MRNKLCLILLIFFPILSRGQNPGIVWQQCHKVGSGETSYSICASDNGYIIAQAAYNIQGIGSYGSNDIVAIAYDSSWNVLWEKCYGGSRPDIPRSIIAIVNNEYLIFGKTYSSDGLINSGNKGGYDFWVLRINSEGDLLSEKTYGSPGNDEPAGIITMPDGGFMFAGNIKSGGGDVNTFYGQTDIWLCRCDALGKIIWEKTIGGSGKEECSQIKINSEGNLLLIGSIKTTDSTSVCSPKGAYDVLLMELDLEGAVLWQQCYGGRYNDMGCCVEETEGGYLIMASTLSDDGDVVGIHNTGGGIYPDIWLFKVRKDASIAWQQCLGGDQTDQPASLFSLEENNILIFGYTFSNNGDISGNHIYNNIINSDIWLAELTASGELSNQRCFGGYFDEDIVSQEAIYRINDQSFVLAAQSFSDSTGDVQCHYTEKGSWLFSVSRCPGYEPAIPEIVSGPDTVLSLIEPSSTFTIAPPANAWTFDWKLFPVAAGTLGNFGLWSTVDWSEDYKGEAFLYARSSNYCGWSNWSEPHKVVVEKNTGINEHSQQNIRIWPNPAFSKLNIELSATNALPVTITFTDLSGRMIYRQTLTQKITMIDCSRLGTGIFLYSILGNNTSSKGKLMINP